MGDFKEVLLIVNPISGAIEKEDTVQEVGKQVKQDSAKLHVLTTTGQDDDKAIAEIIKNNSIDRILIAGGDGTINLVSEVVKTYSIPLGIIPAGSANGLALNLDIPQDLKAQVAVALGSKFIELDLLCLNSSICLHMSDLGINAELIANYEDSGVRGKLGYILQSIPTLVKSEFPFEFEIVLPDDRLHRKGVLLAFANANKYGTGANINPTGCPNDGIFEILIFKDLDLVEIIKTLNNEVDLNTDFVEVIHTKNVKVICKKPVPFQIDGEYMGKQTEIDAEILSQKLKIAIPERQS